MMIRRVVLFCALLLVLLPPQLVHGGCTCDEEDEAAGSNKSESIKYKIIAIAAILVASGIGVIIPILSKSTVPFLKSVDNVFVFVKAFAGGVILATGFIHVLPDAFESLTSPCIADNPWGKFPFTGLVAMVAAVFTLMIESAANSYFFRKGPVITTSSRPASGDEEKVVQATVQAGHSHRSSDHLSQRVVAQVYMHVRLRQNYALSTRTIMI